MAMMNWWSGSGEVQVKRFGLHQVDSRQPLGLLNIVRDPYSLDRTQTIDQILSIDIHSQRKKNQVYLFHIGHERYRLSQDLGSSRIGDRSADLNPVSADVWVQYENLRTLLQLT
jgi:hypothetical protein